MSKYSIQAENDGVTICQGKECDFLEGFIDIYVDEKGIPSPFKTIDDAILFAEIIIKLLEVVS